MSLLRPLSRSPRPLLLPLLLALAACSADRTDAPAMPEVGVIIASAQPLALQQTLPGRAVPFEISEVRPQIGGLIRQRLFTEGQQVKAGQLLYQVDPAPYQAAFDTARGQLAQAEATVLSAQPKAERTRALVSMDAASKQDADDATSALKQAQANVIAARAALQAARINLDYTRVTAPIDGRIGTSSVTAGALVAAGQDTALTTIQRLDPVYLDVTQSSTQMLALRKRLDAGLVKAIDGKAQVKVLLEDGSTYAHEGTLEFVGSAVDPGTGNVKLRAVIPNPDGLLLPGMYLKAVLPMATDARALLVPQKAVVRNERGEPLLRLLDAKDHVVERRVSTGQVVGNQWQITSGLKAGERVIVSNGSAVSLGQQVKAVAATTAQLAAMPAVDPNGNTDEKSH
ncbi:TPA: multidrug efflux RND transporter periplasmic adaptor subunit SmeA [Stenotrophomonas maltophilia]|uniref:multidrug efflux RND transporter periplasmic adaptor subunit SmeA n=1 Tax=Stenotrophomonas maltophilia TaxID=40324 RepID=UPI000C156814|nr:multidrug efflux RND transporter periplasmic adaptor subunit SmeA [Stenotrophomonas maltophilia]EKU9982624.1 multidrug efflux RND transporter periplasmic adaptor subunit SmeA [Stenotrophomonas maltophilia]EKX6274725.1 multidrug efflux RND transporter periplasmic adaptor subunit SmeA [Stenotrophomonas maltophilia]MBA0234294.1 multidrug efflux RND transporter periplasmic adaptor subunit SmeA [Stenotrophomonas maltophilia]MBA0268670.1 multidrug efflux RND transporter periplasmic adaptor subunit